MRKKLFIGFNISIIVMFLFAIAVSIINIANENLLSDELKNIKSFSDQSSQLKELQSELKDEQSLRKELSSQLNELENTYKNFHPQLKPNQGV